MSTITNWFPFDNVLRCMCLYIVYYIYHLKQRKQSSIKVLYKMLQKWNQSKGVKSYISTLNQLHWSCDLYLDAHATESTCIWFDYHSSRIQL